MLCFCPTLSSNNGVEWTIEELSGIEKVKALENAVAAKNFSLCLADMMANFRTWITIKPQVQSVGHNVALGIGQARITVDNVQSGSCIYFL